MILSVEINDNSINVVHASKMGETLLVSKCMTVNIPSLAEDGIMIDVDYAADEINEALSNKNIKIGRTVFVVNSSSIIVRKLELPLLKKRSETISMIKYELEQLMPVDLRHYKITYKIAGATKNKKKAYYVVYCLPVKLFGQYTRLASKLKLKFSTLDICCNCLNKVFQHKISINNSIVNYDDIAAFIRIGADKISFSVLNKGVCDFFKISEIFNDKYGEIAAEGQAVYLTDDYSGTDDFMYKCLEEINKYIRYYRSVENESEINKLYIFGSNFNESMLQLLSRSLGIETVSLDKISNVEISSLYFNCIFDIHKFFVPILSLFNNEKDVCFLLKSNYFNVRSIRFTASAAAIILACAGAGCMFSIHNDKFQAMKVFISDEGNVALNSEIEDLKRDISILTEQSEHADFLKSAAENDNCVSSEIFREILYALPRDTNIISASVDKTSTQLTCFSASVNEAALFLNNLRKIHFIKNISVPTIELIKDISGGYSYSIVCTLKDVREFDK